MNVVGEREKTEKVGAPDTTMLPAVLRRGAILFVVRDGQPVRCFQDMSNVEPGEKVYHAGQLSGG
jgi:hypothetical protein